MGILRSLAEMHLGHPIEKEYEVASKEYYSGLVQQDDFDWKDNQLMTHHIGSVHKKANLYKMKSRIYHTREFILECIGQDELKKSTFMDVGCASDMFFKYLGVLPGKGAGVNVSQEDVDAISASGYVAKRVEDEILPFQDKEYDYSLSFECLEHTFSPMLSLMEMKRVSKKGIFISVPYRQKTVFVKKEPRSTPATQHIFEFSIQDLQTLCEHIGLRVVIEKHVPLEAQGDGLIQSLIRKRQGWGKPGVQFAFLKPV